MKFKGILIILSLLLAVMFVIGSAAAVDEDNLNNNLTACSAIDSLDATNQDDLAASSTITVDSAGENHNEMNDKTIQKALNDAKSGDTIIVNGESYEHVHRTIDKKITIKSEVGTTLTPCSSNAESGYHGIFYLTEKASGTVIEGFNFKGSGMLYGNGDYGILINGASNVIIRNCTFSDMDSADAIRLVNAKGVTIDNVEIDSAVNGVNIIDSLNTVVENSDIKNNKISSVSVSGSSKNTKIIYNNLTNNVVGVNITSANYVYILSNYIAYNSRHGVYINCNITKIEIKGNFFNQNKYYEILNDYKVRNLMDNVKTGTVPDLEIIDNNYMVGLKGANEERPVYRNSYEYRGDNNGEFSYDSVNDVFYFVGDNNGDYTLNKGAVFLRYVFEINKNVNCPVIFYQYGPKSWSVSGNYELQLSEITQIKKGVYSISIVDANGNVAKDLSSVPVTFYLNKKISNTIQPDEGDIYKVVMMKNGTATVRFYPDEFKESGNVLIASVPSNGRVFDDKISKTLAVDDASVPGTPTNTTLSVSNLNTYPKSNQQLVVTLKDSNGNPVVGETVTVKLNSKTYNLVTDSNGKATVKVSIAKEGSYTASITYAGDDIDYLKTTASAKVIVKKQTAKLISSNLNMIPKMAEYYSVTLKDASGKAISSQKVIFKVNGKTYTKKTNSKGVVKLKLKFSKNKKTYSVKIQFKGNNKYKAVSKTNKIHVKYSSKTAKLSTPALTLTPKTSKTYTVTLKDGNGKGISKQKVTVKINGKKYTKKTNSKGQIKIKVKFSGQKTYKVSASYKGSKIYKKATSNGKIKVVKAATKITAPNISLIPNETKTYTVTLKTSAGKAISKEKLTIKVNGESYTKTTNSKGQTSLSLKFADEKTYSVNVNYKGNTIYKSTKTTAKVNVERITSEIESYNKTYSSDAKKDYSITLKDKSGNALANYTLNYSINGQNSSQITDANGQIKLDLSNGSENSYDISIKFEGDGRYKSASKTNKITISDKTGITFVDSDLPNSEIQNILNSALKGDNIEFLGDYYFNIALEVNNSVNIYSNNRTVLNAEAKSPVFKITSDNVNVTGFSLQGNSGDAIVIDSAEKVAIIDNFISNNLNVDKIQDYLSGNINLPGYGISILNSSDVKIQQNSIDLFESGIYAQNSHDINIDNNTLRENNYGIKYGFGVADTQIIRNEITEQTGLYIMTVPEGPSGYGIFLNNSAVNVTINNNYIAYNHLGISLDANYSTGIVITQNVISDNVLEGIRFNAGYDLAENAVEPVVTDNAIYRNAVGPSMMILGEMSANPEGIYGAGQWNDSLRLKIGPNWYGTNELVRWDFDTGVVGYGTMCPRISTTAIKFNNLTCNSPGNYSIVFYKNGEVASDLPEFEMFATLNFDTSNEIEVKFMVVNGVGTFAFDSNNFNETNNKIDISVGSLIDSTYRTFKITSSYEVPQSEIPI